MCWLIDQCIVCPLAWLVASLMLLRRRITRSTDAELGNTGDAKIDEPQEMADMRWARRCFLAWTVLCAMVGLTALVAMLVVRH